MVSSAADAVLLYYTLVDPWCWSRPRTNGHMFLIFSTLVEIQKRNIWTLNLNKLGFTVNQNVSCTLRAHMHVNVGDFQGYYLVVACRPRWLVKLMWLSCSQDGSTLLLEECISDCGLHSSPDEGHKPKHAGLTIKLFCLLQVLLLFWPLKPVFLLLTPWKQVKLCQKNPIPLLYFCLCFRNVLGKSIALIIDMFYTILYKVHTDYVQYRSVFQAQAFRNDCVVRQEKASETYLLHYIMLHKVCLHPGCFCWNSLWPDENQWQKQYGKTGVCSFYQPNHLTQPKLIDYSLTTSTHWLTDFHKAHRYR